ncbi:Lipopolysaccharide export system ATP-binding protein LptB [compost metagenome]
MIRVQNIQKRFGRLEVLKQLSLELNAGECIALLGPNGCGKTTVIKSILGMVLPDAGQITFEGTDIRRDNLYRRHIGYMPQIGRYPENMTIRQVIRMIRGIRKADHAITEPLYAQFGIEKMLDKKMRTLSGGTTQKVSAVLAFMFNPKVLILDEPTAGLDPVAAEILKKRIIDEKNNGRLILITSHLLSKLEELASEVVFMQEGQVVFHKKMPQLKADTGQETLAKAIVALLKSGIS